jgi:inner membrane protein
MPTIFSHPAPLLALGAGLGLTRLPGRLLLAAGFFAIVPDLDVIGFRLGINYGDIGGHRGFSHSLGFALLCALLGWGAAPLLRCRRAQAAALIFGAVLSHIVLDAATSGGLGVAVFWPFSENRYFLPWRPIRVSPLSLRSFLGPAGAAVLLSELRLVWLPCLGLALGLRLLRRSPKPPAAQSKPGL